MTSAVAISEAEWQDQFIQLARILGWKHMHVRRSLGRGRKWVTATNVDGWPDLTMWHPTQKRVMFVELKSESGRLRPCQEVVLRSLIAAGQEVHVLRPSDLERARLLLTVTGDETEPAS